MDFEYFLDKENKRRKRKKERIYYPDGPSIKKSYSSSTASFNPIMFVESLKNNKKLKVVLVLILVVVLALIVGLITIIFPVIEMIITKASQNGVSGLIDEAIKFLNNIGNGT